MSIFDQTNKALDKKLARKRLDQPQFNLNRERDTLLKAVGTDLAKLITPALTDATERILKGILSKQVIQVEAPKVTVPTPIVNVSSPDVYVPTPIANVSVPPIKIPDINIPQMKWPTGDMPIKGTVSLEGINASNPLSVQIRDSKGNPVDVSAGGSIISGGGGGKADFFTIKGYAQSAFSELQNADGRLKVSVETGGSGLTDAELRASSVPVAQASGAIWSTNVTGQFGTTYSTSDLVNSDNRLRVSVETGGSGLTDAELRATPVAVSGTVAVSGITNSVAASIIDSSGVGYSGSNPLPVTIASGGSATTASVPVDVDGIAYDGDNPAPVQMATLPDTAAGDLAALVAGQLPDGHNVTVDNASIPVTGTFWQATQPVSGTVAVSGIANSVASALIDSSGVQYSSSNPVPIDDAGGSLTVDGTVAVSGVSGTVGANIVDSSGVAYTTSNPVPIDDAGGSITVDGTVAVSGLTGSVVAVPANNAGLEYDSDNPQPMIETTVRGGRKSAYVSLTTGTETALLAGESGYYHDLVYVMCANQSDVAVAVDFRQTTGGTVQMTVEVPANGTAGIAPSKAIPQDHQDASWTVDMEDITGTTVDITAGFIKASS